MADISKELLKIKRAIYGEEVRESIVDALNKVNKFSDDGLFEVREDLDWLKDNISIDPDDLGLEQDEDSGFVYPTYRGVRSVNGIPLASSGGGGGGGGSGNNAVITVTNTTGWLSTTISSGAECYVSVRWSSLEDNIPTGNGSMSVKVDGVTKKTQNIEQGEFRVEVGSMLASGSNKVKITVSDVYDNARTITYTITVVSLTISSSFDTSGTFSAGEPIAFTYTPIGALDKTVYFVVDNETVGTSIVSVSNRQQTYQLPEMIHGSHVLKVYFTATVEGETVRSNTLIFSLIVVDATSSDPIISTTFEDSTTTQYTTLAIPYTVYTPDILTSDVVLSVNNIVVSTLTGVDRTEHIWSFRADDIGTTTLKITSGSASKEFTLTVTKSDIDVEAETDSLSLYLTSRGRSNNEADPSIWEDRDHNVSCTLTGFNFVSDGWQLDQDGATVLRVSGDSRVEIPYKIFANDFRATGKTIEVEFTTRNILNYDSTIISCYNGDRGFKLTAQKALMKSEQSEISTQYKEDEHVRISFVTDKRTEDQLLYIYINGIMSGVVRYPDADDFSQTDPVNITIGSNQCDTDIYCIRVYDNNLTRYQIVNNWIADTQNVTQMLSRYNHNNVYDEYGNVVIEKLPNDLPYMVIEAPQLPQYKGDKKTVSGYYTDPSSSARSFTFTGAQADVQGTSSQYYPRKNYKIKFKNGFVINGEQSKTYKLRSDSVGVNTFTFKADVASSEGANNVELARLYDDTCPYKTPPQLSNPSIRQGIDGFPIIIFWSDGTNITFIGKYNFNNDKATEEVFGFVNGDESWEVKNNTSDRVLWKSADYSGTDWLNDFEARYPDTEPAYADNTQLKELATWLVSVDPDQATNSALPESVTIVDGETSTTYTNDTAAYRKAKFRNELHNYVEVDSAIFYYLFTELFLMVDSRAKNMFPSFMGEVIE